MITDQINGLITKLQSCKSYFETYRNGEKKEIQFSNLWPDILNVIDFFKCQGIMKGDHVGIIGTNSYEWVIIDFACIATGIISVPFDPAQRYEIAAVSSKFNLKALLTNQKDYENKGIENIFFFNDVIGMNKNHSIKKLAPVQYEAQDVLTYKFTTGTTSRPKVIGAMKQSVDAAITFVQDIFRHDKEDKIMVFLPLHTYQQRYWIYSAVLFDFNLLLVPKEYVFYSMQADKPTVIMGVPFFFETIMKNFLDDTEDAKAMSHETLSTRFQNYLGGRIRYLWTGSAPISRDTITFYEDMDIPLYQGYGMNEVCIVSKNYRGHNKTGSVGKLLPGKYIKFDEYNQLLIKSDYPVNTKYYQAFEEDNTVTFMNDGYVATGDTGYMDEDGFLYINGRLKELIVLANAVKIHPSAIEKKVEQLVLVKHCIVYGDRHPYLVALIVPKSCDISKEEIGKAIRSINETLNVQEKICNFIVIDNQFLFEKQYMSGQNKILRKKVINEYQSKLEKLYNNE